MKDLSLIDLYEILERIEGKYPQNEIDLIKEAIYSKEILLEDTSATGGSSTSGSVPSGMGAVISSQPSVYSGSLNGVAWNSGGGTEGSGDISVPYNPSGGKRLFQKIPQMGMNHGPMTGKKSRTKPLDVKSIKSMMSSKKPAGKVMSFDNFLKYDINKVTKVKEGKAFQTNKKTDKENIGSERIPSFQVKIENHISGLGAKVKKIGNDFEVLVDKEVVAQVMFRDSYIGVKKSGSKFATEYQFNELGKIKSKLTEIIKK